MLIYWVVQRLAMDAQIKHLEKSQLNEYLLIIRPHAELLNKIIQVKQLFAEKFKNENALYVKPHLALVKFCQFATAEERIVNKLRALSMGLTPVKIELKNFGNYPTHTIFINVTSKVQIETLVKSIRTNTQQLMRAGKDHKPFFMMQPHFNIGQKLLPWQFEKAWLEYRHRQFTGRFMVDEMLLLKKNSDKKYLITERFQLKNMPVSTTQGTLFNCAI